MLSSALLLLGTAAFCGVGCVELTQTASVVVKPRESFSISCKISVSSYCVHWIRQPTGKSLEWLGYQCSGGSTKIKDTVKNKISFSQDTSSSTVFLRGQNFETEDTAVYYCARGDADAFDYWGKGTMVTVSSGVQSAPSSVFAVSQCVSGSDEFRTLGCLTSGFSPADDLKFKWTDPQGTALTDFVQYPAIQTSGSYTSVSHVRVKASDWSAGKSFTCTAEHPAGSKQHTVKKPEPKPTINLVKVSDGKSIMCVLENFSPKSFTVKWKEDGADVTGLDLPATQTKADLYSAGSILQVTESKWKDNVEYTCEVTHNGKTYTENQTFTAALNVKIKGPDVKELFINNRAVMECVITGDNEQEVKEAKVSWTLNNQNQDGNDGKVQKTGQQYTKSSILDLDQTAWFSGNKVECSTTWRNKPISDNVTVNKRAQAPTLLIYKPEEKNSDKVSLVCEVNDSPLGDVYVMWRKNGNQYIEGNITSSVIKNDNSMSVFSTLTVTKQEYDDPKMTFNCAVKHAGMENYSIPLLKTTSKIPEEQIVLYTDGATLDEDEYSSLWSTASSFIFLFIFSLIYSTVLSLSKMKS